MESNLQSTIDSKCSASRHHPRSLDRDAKFLAMLPRIRRQAAYYLRHLSKKERAEAVQEVVASAFVSYVRLIERGKADLAYAGPLARYGACQYLAGRRVGNRMNGHDVTLGLTAARRKECRSSNSITSTTRLTNGSNWSWKIRHSGPADVAATRVDFRAWLESLPVRTRHVAETLATGEATSHVARMFGCSASRISQLRRELYHGLACFHGRSGPGDIISFGVILDVSP